MDYMTLGRPTTAKWPEIWWSRVIISTPGARPETPHTVKKASRVTKPSSVKRERHMFYSKPPLIMWMMAAGMNLFGFNEVGVRFFFLS